MGALSFGWLCPRVCKFGSKTIGQSSSHPLALALRMSQRWPSHPGVEGRMGPSGSYLRGFLMFNGGDGDQSKLGYIGEGMSL